jgi:hypothetical protein
VLQLITLEAMQTLAGIAYSLICRFKEVSLAVTFLTGYCIFVALKIKE